MIESLGAIGFMHERLIGSAIGPTKKLSKVVDVRELFVYCQVPNFAHRTWRELAQQLNRSTWMASSL